MSIRTRFTQRASARWTVTLVGVMLTMTFSSTVVDAHRGGSGGQIAPAVSSVRHTSCQGYDFYAIDTFTTGNWALTPRMRYRTDTGINGSGFFLCDPGLPDKAVVTRLRFTLYDASSSSQLQFCMLVRGSLSAATADAYDVLGQVDATGITAAPGNTRPADTTIDFATIDNAHFGYWLQCQFSAADVATGIIGADVRYTPASTGGSAAPAATTVVRSVSCHGLNFYPTSHYIGFGYVGVRRWGGHLGGNGLLACDVRLPQGATVTKVSFTLYDVAAGSQQARACGLYRESLQSFGATAGVRQEVAMVQPTGTTATPGTVTLTDTTILNPVVDNGNWAYGLQCGLNWDPYGIGLYGATVKYTIASHPATTQSTSCHAWSFQPIDGQTLFAWNDFGGLRHRWKDPDLHAPLLGDGYFLCNARLPDGATVNRVRFTLGDEDSNDQLIYCGLIRVGQSPATSETVVTMASVLATGLGDRPGYVRRTTEAITSPVIDNSRYAYWLQCNQVSYSSAVGILGADVRYTIAP